MTVVIFVRHGLNDYVQKGRLAGRVPEVHLNKKGRKQAELVANLLKHVPISAVYSSPLERTMETAYPIARKLKLDVIPRNGLLEVDFGDWQNKKLKKLSKLDEWKIVQGNPSRMQFPGGESFHEAQQRVVAEIDELVGLHDKDKNILCVSHSDVIKLAVAFYIGLPLDLFQRLHIAPASLTVIYISNTGSRLLTLNYESSFTLVK